MMPSVRPAKAAGTARCCSHEKIFCSVRVTRSVTPVMGMYLGVPVEPLVCA